MKQTLKIFALMAIAVAFAAMPVAAKKDKGGEARIKFTEDRHDFGLIDENGGPVSCVFEFVNAGNGNLVIKDVRTQCGCTRPEYPQNPIAPGKKGKIKITFLPQGRPGSLNKTATVYTNGKPGKVVLQIKGRVAPKNKK